MRRLWWLVPAVAVGLCPPVYLAWTIYRDVLGSDLYNACTGHDFDEAKALVKRGADVNYETDPGSDTPLMAAVDSKDVRMVSFLIQDWANVSHVDDDGHSVLWHARLSPVITKMLKEAGAAR